MKTDEMRILAKKMIKEGVDGADPELSVRNNFSKENGIIELAENTYLEDDYEKILVFGIGKAAVAMGSGLNGLKPDDGLVITKKGHTYDDHRCPVPIREASHPYPAEENLKAAKELLDKLDGVENALIIFLISGGGSALFLSPADDISVLEMKELNEKLVRSGADIYEMNSVRKHVSEVKGGRFAKICEGKGELISLIISDVVGDDMSVIASGPTYPDDSTFENAVDVLKKYGLWDDTSSNIKNHLVEGIEGSVEETPEDVQATNILIGNNLTALKEAEKVAKKEGFNTIILTSHNKGEAKEVARPLVSIAKEIQDSGNPIKTPAAIILGGETTVSLDEEKGKGGPNRELVLSAAVELKGRENIVVASVDSDGIDGMDKAGAIADHLTVKRSKKDPEEFLKKHDSQKFFEALNDNLEIESRTNVNDITIILVGED